ncbi:MAG: carbohydrate kinase, partial [Anaerolineae bacterium]
RVTEAGALGAAILAGAGCGVFSSVAEGVGQMVQLDTTFEPNAVLGASYTQRYEQYRQLYAPLRGLLHSLAAEPTTS